jgi:PAS domain S-box-containing protein
MSFSRPLNKSRPQWPGSPTGFQAVFEASPNPYLLVAPDDPVFTIVGVNGAYLSATKTDREEIIGLGIFEAFPDNPEDPQADGVRNLHSSLRRVLETKAPDSMAIQKYDSPRPAAEGGGFEQRYWKPLNTPVFAADGSIEAIIHHVTDVTSEILEKQSSREALRRSEEQFRLIVDSATDFAIVATDLEGRITTWNTGAKRLLGYDEAEILGRDAAMIFTPEDRVAGRVDKEMRGALQNGRAEDERWHLRKDGSRFWASGLIMTLKDDAGEVRGFLKIMRDRTHQRETGQALQASERSLRLAIDAGRMAIWNLDMATDEIVGSPELSRVLGFPADARPTTQEIRSRYAPGEQERLRAAGQAALARGERSLETEFRYLHPNGSERWLMLRAEALFDDGGNPVRAVGVVMDIDDRKRAELALQESEERFRLVADSAPVMLWMGNASGKCLYLNRVQREFWGVAVEDIPSFDWNTTIHPEDARKLFEPFEKGMRTRTSFAVEARYRRADGEFRILHTEAQPRFGPGGEFLGMIGVNVDVTETREAEEALRRESRLLEIVNETGAAVAAERDLDRIVQKITDAGVEITGAQFGAFFYNVVDDQGESYTLYALSGVPREAFSKFPMPRNTHVFGPTFRGESVVRSDDIIADPRYGRNEPYKGMPEGHLPVRSYLAVPVVSRSGEVLGGLFFGHATPGVFSEQHERLLAGIAGHAAIAVDNAHLFRANELELAQRRRAEEDLQSLNATLEQRVEDEVAHRFKAEEALRQAQKMEAVGQLTGGIAHDFNNMLAVVIGGLNLLQRRIAKGETDVSRYIEAAMEGANRAAGLTQRLLAFSRQQPLAPEPIQANRLVAGMTELLTRTLGEDIKIETVLSAGLWQTSADPGQLESTILNLAVNARDAMPNGGKLTIETANAHVDDDYAREFEISSGQYVLLCVSDTGTGMSPEVMAKAFDPFYTTKMVGKGTGLGLSQVFGFVRQTGGHVKIYSEVGHGTTVKVYLPRFYGEAPTAAPRSAQGAARSGNPGEIVMVVEDEERVRNYSVEALRELGYTVVQADSGAVALRMIEAGQDVTLLFTDVVMPEMNGRELADRAVEKLPKLKVLYTTGYTRNAVVHNGTLDPGTNFLPKPFGIDQLAAKVRSVLDS